MKFDSLEDKKQLAARVLHAYFLVTGKYLHLSGDAENRNYDLLTEVIQETNRLPNRKAIPGIYALVDFFFTDKKLGIRPKTAELFEEFIKNAELISLQRNKVAQNQSGTQAMNNDDFSGADLINRDFMIRIIRESQCEPKDFYLKKDNYGCQWYGTFKGWDSKAPHYGEVKDAVIKSFDTNNPASNIAAVLYGDSGDGKSTFLRRLAFECIGCKFSTFWLTNLNTFINNIETIKRSTSKSYLLVIEDWKGLVGESGIGPSFIFEITKLKNVRLVIADESIGDQPYFDYFNQRDAIYITSVIFILDVLDKVFDRIPEWSPFMPCSPHERFYSLRTISTALFAIHNAWEKETKTNNTESKGAEVQFLKITKHKLELIDGAYPGIAKALIYWCHIYREFGDSVLMTWNALFKLASLYAPGQESRKLPVAYDSNDEIFHLLLKFIRLKRLVYPKYINEHLIYFNHDLIIEEAFTKVNFKGLRKYDESVISEMINFFLSLSDLDSIEFGIGALIEIAYRQKYKNDINVKFAEGRTVSRFIREHYAIRLRNRCYHIDMTLRWAYDAASQGLESVDRWQGILNRLVLEYFSLELDRQDMMAVLKTLIHEGCLDKHVALAYNTSSKGWIPFRYCMSRIFHENASGIDKNYYYDTMSIKPWGRKFKTSRWVSRNKKALKSLFISGNSMTENENSNLKN